MARAVRSKSQGIVCATASSSPFVLYTCPANCQAKIVFLRATNSNGSSNTVTVTWTDTSETLDVDLFDDSIDADTSVDIINESYLMVDASDTIEITISGDGDVNVVITVEEIFEVVV